MSESQDRDSQMNTVNEYLALKKRDLFVRRGRNNRIYSKFITKEIFEDNFDSNDDDMPP